MKQIVSSDSIEFTSKELRKKFIKQIYKYINEAQKRPHSKQESLETLAFEILSLIDGSQIDTELPAFILAPLTGEHQGEYPNNSNVEIKCDISYGLSDIFHNMK